MPKVFVFLSILLLQISVNGCALPVSVTATSWAVDGISYATTKKSLADHGISFVAGQDCALYRIIKNFNIDEVCKSYNNSRTAVVSIADASQLIETSINRKDIDDTFYGFDLTIPKKY